MHVMNHITSQRKAFSFCQVRHGGLLGPPIGQYLDRAAATLEEQHRLATDGRTLQVNQLCLITCIPGRPRVD